MLWIDEDPADGFFDRHLATCARAVAAADFLTGAEGNWSVPVRPKLTAGDLVRPELATREGIAGGLEKLWRQEGQAALAELLPHLSELGVEIAKKTEAARHDPIDTGYKYVLF